MLELLQCYTTPLSASGIVHFTLKLDICWFIDKSHSSSLHSVIHVQCTCMYLVMENKCVNNASQVSFITLGIEMGEYWGNAGGQNNPTDIKSLVCTPRLL